MSARILRLTVVAGLAIVGVAITTGRGQYDLVREIGWTLAFSVTPAVALAILKPRSPLVVVGALVFAVVPVGVQLHQNMAASDHPALRTHDGAVVATEAAARLVLDGENPYAARYDEVLAPVHHPLRLKDGTVVQANPLIVHHPYLPLSFLVHVPFVAVTDALDVGYDPRVLYLTAFVAALLALATWPRTAMWSRAAAILMAGSFFVVSYLSWGTNDAAAASLVIVALRLLDRAPLSGGLLLAVALSMKPIVALALLPVFAAHLLVDRQRARQLASLPILLLVSVLPFVLAGPRALLEDTVEFNLGWTDLIYPTSGYGLPAQHPDLVRGVVLLAVVAFAFALIATATWATARARLDTHVAIAVGAGCLLLFLLTSRTFQQPYVTLLVLLTSPAWLASEDSRSQAG